MTLHPFQGMGRRRPSTQSFGKPEPDVPLPRSHSFHYYMPRAPPNYLSVPPSPTLSIDGIPVVSNGHSRRPSPNFSADSFPSTSNGHVSRQSSRERLPYFGSGGTPQILTNALKKTNGSLKRSKTASLLRKPQKTTTRLLADARLVLQQVNKKLSTRQLVLIIGILLAVFTTFVYILAGAIQSRLSLNRLQGKEAAQEQFTVDEQHRPQAYWPGPTRSLQYRRPLFETSIDEIHEKLDASPSYNSPSSTPSIFNLPRQLSRLFHRTRRRSGKIKYSIIAACADRTGYLQRVLPTWIEAVDTVDGRAEIVLVDWGTRGQRVPLQAVAEALEDIDIVTATVPDGEKVGWALTRAYNLAATVARGEWLIKLDCDVGIDSQGVEGTSFLDNLDDSVQKTFWRGDWRQAGNENDRHLNGVFLVRATDFWKVGGFDERLVAYGWDDEDLYKRLEESGLRKKVIDSGFVHLSRAEGHYVKDRMNGLLTTEVNELALERLHAWSTESKIGRSTYNFSCRDPECRFLQARIIPKVGSAITQLSTEDRQRVVEEANRRVLHDGYGIPWAVLSEVNRSPHELFQAIRHAENGLIFCEVGGTTAQRMLGIASAIALARKYSRPLFLSWSSGKTDGKEEVPHVADFFDLDNSGLLEHSDSFRHGVQIVQVGRWRCRLALNSCEEIDPVYKRMMEYRTIKSEASNKQSMEKVIAELDSDTGEAGRSVRQNILLRLEGGLPSLSQQDIGRALRALAPSRVLTDQLQKYGDVSDKLGIFLGRGIRKRGMDAMLRRLNAQNEKNVSYFVTGAERDRVMELRKRLDDTTDTVGDGRSSESMSEIESTVRDVAELFVLSKCSSLVNDGRSPEDVAKLLQLLNPE